MRNYTNIPPFNQAMAERHIADNISEALSRKYISRWLLYYDKDGSYSKQSSVYKQSLVYVVNEFMRRYPRGKGTTKDLWKREFYAACYAIQTERSRTQRQRKMINYKLTKREADALLMFPVDGSPIDVTKSVVAFNSLTEHGFITGFYTPHGAGYRPTRLWLTDRGVLLRQMAVAMLKKRESDAIISGKVYQTVGKWTATINIGKNTDAIKINLPTKEEAVDLRDKVLKSLKA